MSRNVLQGISMTFHSHNLTKTIAYIFKTNFIVVVPLSAMFMHTVCITAKNSVFISAEADAAHSCKGTRMSLLMDALH